MAIEIIKNTMVDPIEMTCSCCKSIFTYTFEDIQRREETMFLGMSTTTRRYVTCPVCKYDNDVERVVVKLQKDKETEQAKHEKKSEEIYCTECQHFEGIPHLDNDWFGAKCKLDDHESAPSMYAIQSLYNDCPLKKKQEEEK